MPFKSEAQRKKFQAMLAEGKITQATYDEWEAATGSTKLPSRVGKENPTPDPGKNRIRKRFGK